MSILAPGTWVYDWTNPQGAFSFASDNTAFLNTTSPFLGQTWSDADLTADFTPASGGGFDVSFALTAFAGSPTLSELDGSFVVAASDYTYRNTLGGPGGTTPVLGDFFNWTASPIKITNATNAFASLAGLDAAGGGNYMSGRTNGYFAMDFNAVPEPFSMGLAALGIGLVGVLRRRKTG
jgi:hypothetical protein